MHWLRQAAPKRTRWRGATFELIRRTFVNVAVRVEELKGRIKLAFPGSYPQAAMLAAITTTSGPCPMRQVPREPFPTALHAFQTSPKPTPSTRLPRHATAQTA